MQIKPVTTPVTRSASYAPTSLDSSGPSDSFVPMGEFRRSPQKMAAAGFVTTTSAALLGQAASQIHPLAGVVVGGALGAAAGYHLFPEGAGSEARVMGAVLGGALGGVCSQAVDLAIPVVGVIGAGGGAMAGHMISNLNPR